MAKLFNRAKMTTSTTGSGTVTLGSASVGYQSFADAGVSNGDVVQYVIEEGSNFEIGTGTYSSTGTSLTRSPTESSNSNAAISLTGAATVSITAVADDLNRLQNAGSDIVTVSASGAAVTGNITVTGTVDGRDLSVDGAKLDGIEAGADVTDTTNVTAAGALMDSEVTNLAQVKAFDSSDYATAAQGTTADAALPKAGGTMTGALNLGDNIKAQFGAGSDLQIYHDGLNSYLRDGGTGDLKVLATNFAVKNLGDSINFITTDSSTGAMDLYHNGSSKLATTSTGVDITGTLVADGIDIQGDGTLSGGSRITVTDISDINNDGIRFDDNTTSRYNNLTQDTSGNFRIQHYTGSAWQNNLLVDTSGNVGIGTSSPASSNKLDVVADASDRRIAMRTQNTSGNATVEAQVNNYWSGATYTGTAIQQYDAAATGTTAGLSNANLGVLRFQNGSGGLIYTNSSNPIVLGTNGSERMRLNSSGVDVTGILNSDSLSVNAPSGYGSIEVGGPSGGYIDIKGPFSDDYDGRLISYGSGLVITSGASQSVSLQHGGATKFATTSAGVSVTGTVAATSFSGDGSSLTGIAAGATGGGSDEIFWENGQTVTSNYTITNGKNAMSAGPITINTGVTVTVGSGETWTVV